MCEHGKGNVTSHCSTCIGLYLSTQLLIQGYHIYKDGWDTPIGEVLYYDREIGSCSDPCVVAVKSASLAWRCLTDIILFWVEMDQHKFISGK